MRVLVAMSGGVDSSVALELLMHQGHEVCGITMDLCGNEAAIEDARRLCERFGVPHRAIDLRERFQAEVVGPFCASYMAGATPNPCVDCNRTIKFGELHRIRQQLGFDRLATGHYARIAFDAACGRWQLLRGVDRAKDQSYFLYNLTQDQLAHTLFPLGDLHKDEVRRMARQASMAVAEKPESQDICFILAGDHLAFLKEQLGADAACFRPGPIVSPEGEQLGTHHGLAAYTAGQRKGLGVAAAEPLYVMGKRAASNELVVGTRAEAVCAGVLIGGVNMVSRESITGPIRAFVKTRYRQQPVAARIQPEPDGRLRALFDQPQQSAAPGQSAVIYEGDAVLAGGVIQGGE